MMSYILLSVETGRNYKEYAVAKGISDILLSVETGMN
jgi:hypothetical protein